MWNAHVVETQEQDQPYIINVAPMVRNYSVQCKKHLYDSWCDTSNILKAISRKQIIIQTPNLEVV